MNREIYDLGVKLKSIKDKTKETITAEVICEIFNLFFEARHVEKKLGDLNLTKEERIGFHKLHDEIKDLYFSIIVNEDDLSNN